MRQWEEFKVQFPDNRHFIQFRVVQLEHGGGHCNCWGIANFSVFSTGEDGGRLTVNLTNGCAHESMPMEDDILDGCSPQVEQMFCDGSASVPRGVVSKPHLRNPNGSSLPCENIVNGSHVSDPQPSLPQTCDTFPKNVSLLPLL